MLEYLQSLATSHHRKGVVDEIDGKAKAKVKFEVKAQAKVMRKGHSRIIVQSSNDFLKSTEQLLNKTEVIHISQEEIP